MGELRLLFYFTIMEIRKSERKKAKIKLAIMGPSGSGKTYSALKVAHGLYGNWDKISVIDTENQSADLYSHLGNYNVLPLDAPYSPERYIEAIKKCEQVGSEVIIIDSTSHEWEGIGGILNQHSLMGGNSFTNWNKMTPKHNAFINAILKSPAHVILTVRTKQEYVLNEKNGKFIPQKVGMKGITREGLDYEMTLVFEINMKHYATATKDRTGVFMGKPEFMLGEKVGARILKWCNEDLGQSKPEPQLEAAGTFNPNKFPNGTSH